MWQDIRCGFRTLVRDPGFVLVGALVLALGMGINTALFSIVNSLLFRPLPVKAPDELVYLYRTLPADGRLSGVPFRDYEFFRDHNEAFAEMTVHWGVKMKLAAHDETHLVSGEWVAANYFDALGVRALVGRTFRPEEDHLGNPERAIVISHRLWVRRFRRDPGIVGKQVRLNDGRADRYFSVIGVTGPEFKGISDPWTPSDFWVTLAQAAGREHSYYTVAPIGRLKPGITLEQAQAIHAAQTEQLKMARGQRDTSRAVVLRADKVRTPRDPQASVVPIRLAAAMTVVAAAVLLIAVVNIAGVLLARGVARAGEMAVRLVVGAGRWRIVRQLLTESVLLSILGGTLGVFVAQWLLGLFRAYTPDTFGVDVSSDIRVVTFSAVVCLAVGVMVGLVPALQASKVDIARILPCAAGGVTKQVRGRLRHWVVIPQIALLMLLLLVAGLFVRALMKIELANLGYNPNRVVVLAIGLRPRPDDDKTERRQLAEKHAERTRTFYRRLLGAFAGIPGTEGIGLTSTLPLYSRSSTDFSAVSQEEYLAGNLAGMGTSRASVSPGYFRTMGMSLLSGRDFDERDGMTTPRVAIISEALARRLWPRRDPIGRFVAAKNNFPRPNENVEWLEVVGVVNEIDPILRDMGQTPFIYVPLGQEWQVSAGTLVARVQGDPRPVMQRLKQAVAGADLFSEVYRAQTMEQMVAEILYPRRIAAGILAVSGLIGLLLASVGLYGVISYSVEQRVHEIGVRTALGAQRSDIVHLVIGEGVRVAVIGSAVGFVLAHAAVRITSNLIVAVPATDALTFIVVPLLVGAVIVVACYLPARRAVRVDPMVALREL